MTEQPPERQLVSGKEAAEAAEEAKAAEAAAKAASDLPRKLAHEAKLTGKEPTRHKKK